MSESNVARVNAWRACYEPIDPMRRPREHTEVSIPLPELDALFYIAEMAARFLDSEGDSWAFPRWTKDDARTVNEIALRSAFVQANETIKVVI